MPQVLDAEVLDAGALLRLGPRGRALLDAFTREGEAPARVLTPRRFERRHERKLHDRLHVGRQRLYQSISLLAPQETNSPSGLLQHPNLWYPLASSPDLVRDIQYPPNHLEGAIDRRVRDTIFRLAIADERLQHRHIDRLQPQGSKIRIELLQMIFIIRGTSAAGLQSLRSLDGPRSFQHRCG